MKSAPQALTRHDYGVAVIALPIAGIVSCQSGFTASKARLNSRQRQPLQKATPGRKLRPERIR